MSDLTGKSLIPNIVKFFQNIYKTENNIDKLHGIRFICYDCILSKIEFSKWFSSLAAETFGLSLSATETSTVETFG